ncbi:MAG TPA: hypothetical protein VJ757_15135 [Pseudonocardiaceae bacterium]|nr:hypothetical protein [Pseudonocardiaceae bacterium]
MISTRRLVAVAMLCPAIAVAGCSSGTGGPSGNSAASTTSVSPALPPATDAAGLAALLRRGISSVSSVHLVLNVTNPNQTISSNGDAKLAGGTLQALDITEELGAVGKRRLLIVDQATYAQLGGAANPAGKPWLLITPDSTNPTVRNLAASLEAVRRSASLDHFTAFASAARSVTLAGKESVNGTPVDHYSIQVDVAKLPAGTPGREPLLATGITTLPIELYVDDQGRPVKATQDLTVQGQHTSTVITFSKFNEPVSITPPPADQVSTS